MKIGLRTPLFIVVTAPTASISRTPSDNLAQSRVFRRSAIRMPVRWPTSPNSARGRCARTGIREGGKDTNPWNRHKRRRRAHVARGQFPDQSAALLPALRLGASVARSTITGGHRKERWLTGRCNVDRRRSPASSHGCGAPPATETTRRGRCSISAFSPHGLSAGDANVVAADVGRVASTARLKPRASEAKGLQTTP